MSKEIFQIGDIPIQIHQSTFNLLIFSKYRGLSVYMRAFFEFKPYLISHIIWSIFTNISNSTNETQVFKNSKVYENGTNIEMLHVPRKFSVNK